MSQKVLGVIPARYASSRFPGKPLIMINGMSMIQRVYEQALKSELISRLIVATDDERIASHVKSFGGNVCMTLTAHTTGTERCAEAVQNENANYDIVINIQGDEPFIKPSQINDVVKLFCKYPFEITTLIKKISFADELNNPNVVKAVVNSNGNVLYFSRSIIPFYRNAGTETALKNFDYYKHIGIYGYQMAILKEIVLLPQSKLEKAESLEQLRWVEELYSIGAAETTEESYAIDTPEDLQRIEKLIEENKLLTG